MMSVFHQDQVQRAAVVSLRRISHDRLHSNRVTESKQRPLWCGVMANMVSIGKFIYNSKDRIKTRVRNNELSTVNSVQTYR